MPPKFGMDDIMLTTYTLKISCVDGVEHLYLASGFGYLERKKKERKEKDN